MSRDGHVLRTQYDKDGNPYQVLEAGMGTRGPARGVRWFLCTTCHQAYPEDKLEWINGAPFSVENGCADEERDRIEKVERGYNGSSNLQRL